MRVMFERIPSTIIDRAMATIAQEFGVIHSPLPTIQRVIGCAVASLYQRRAMHETQTPQ